MMNFRERATVAAAVKLGCLSPEDAAALRAEVARLQMFVPALPVRSYGLPRYGIRWNGPSTPISVPMADGYWTPWHIAVDRVREAFAEGAQHVNNLCAAGEAMGVTDQDATDYVAGVLANG